MNRIFFFNSEFLPMTVNLKLIYSKNYFNLSEIFVLSLFKTVANLSAPGWNRVLSSNLWWLKSVNGMKFTEEYVMHTEKHVLA